MTTYPAHVERTTALALAEKSKLIKSLFRLTRRPRRRVRVALCSCCPTRS
jgi:hypothetical protein